MKKLKEIAKAEMTQTFSLEVSDCGKIVEVLYKCKHLDKHLSMVPFVLVYTHI